MLLAPSRRPQSRRQPTSARLLTSQRETDTESALMHFRARSYDPRTGRFVERDPLLKNRVFDPYAYAQNSPLKGRDPSGMNLELNSEELERIGGERAKDFIIDMLRKSFREPNANWMWNGNRLQGGDNTFLSMTLADEMFAVSSPIGLDRFFELLNHYSKQKSEAELANAKRGIDGDTEPLSQWDARFVDVHLRGSGVAGRAGGVLFIAGSVAQLGSAGIIILGTASVAAIVPAAAAVAAPAPPVATVGTVAAAATTAAAQVYMRMQAQISELQKQMNTMFVQLRATGDEVGRKILSTRIVDLEQKIEQLSKEMRKY